MACLPYCHAPFRLAILPLDSLSSTDCALPSVHRRDVDAVKDKIEEYEAKNITQCVEKALNKAENSAKAYRDAEFEEGTEQAKRSQGTKQEWSHLLPTAQRLRKPSPAQLRKQTNDAWGR